MNFWSNLERPFFISAPMEGITDAAFRYILAKYGKPDIIFTEFSSIDGLVSEKGRPNILKDLRFDKSESPVVAQLFGSDPKLFFEAAKIIAELGFDGIDINMGCPDKDVVKQGAGANLISRPELAKEIIAAVKEGAGEKPVSVKTRLGYNQIEIETWLPTLLESKPAAITIHGRTKKQRFLGSSDWELIGQAKELTKSSGVPIIGNGDVQTCEEGIEKCQKYNLDGFMVGRALIGNPWFFNKEIKKSDLALSEILAVLLEHAVLFENLLGDAHRFIHMRKHIAWYLKGFPDIKELKLKLMQAEDSKQLEQTIKSFFLI